MKASEPADDEGKRPESEPAEGEGKKPESELLECERKRPDSGPRREKRSLEFRRSKLLEREKITGDAEAEGKKGVAEGLREKKGGLGIGPGLGRSNSSMKPPKQMGQASSPAAEGSITTVRLHWWQKYRIDTALSPPKAGGPVEDISPCRERERERERGRKIGDRPSRGSC